MKTITMLKPELEDQSFGSSFDPVLTGVAHGLARLFPPVQTVRGRDRDENAPKNDRVGTGPVGSHRRS